MRGSFKLGSDITCGGTTPACVRGVGVGNDGWNMKRNTFFPFIEVVNGGWEAWFGRVWG